MSTSTHIGQWDPSRAFTWRDGERTIRFGRGVAATAVDAVDGDFTLITTGRGFDEAPGLARAADQVHLVPPGQVDELARELRGRVRGGTLLALGGGRVIDVAKALAAADPPRRVVAIPTTLSGAEMTAIHRMIPGLPPGRARVRPAVVLADPLVMASSPSQALAATAMNALGHAAEAPLTPRANPVASMAAHRAAGLLAAGLGDVPDQDALALGAILGGYAVGSAGYGMHHVMAQTLAQRAGIGHGPANAVLLPHTLRALAGGAGDRWPPGLDLVAAAEDGARRAGAVRLRDLGVPEDALGVLAAAAARRPELGDTPGAGTEAGVREIYAAAW
ncbi:MAG: iron-containing alcohol dehydrogenase [Thermoleophilia bacterium]|nr:iron-containing alcohol dehydrogenase [Thermoleophilia bacterium]